MKVVQLRAASALMSAGFTPQEVLKGVQGCKGWGRTAECLVLWPDAPSRAPGGAGAAPGGKVVLSSLLKKSTR